ncbi:MAG TPA: ABC transporter ATP-binding protein, partial [Planctomycetota bacterium]
GKTTFMRMVTGLARPSRGFVEVFGQRMGPDSWAQFRRIGYVPGDDVQFETERAIDFLVMLARLGGENGVAARARAEKALNEVDLLSAGEKRLSAMSKGMRQRVKVAQALLFDPELLLLDEPLNGMDPVSRRKMMDLVRRYDADGRTVVFASHILHEVEAVTDRVLMLHHGRLLAEGRLEEIRALLERKPREVRLDTSRRREIAATLLSEERVSGVSFGEDGRLVLATRDLDGLLARIADFGADGGIEGMEIADENLEVLFDMLVGEAA